MRWLKIAILSLAMIIVSWATLHANFFRVHDFTHGARIAEFTRAFTDGHIPVRWSMNFGYGYGMPAFEFYAPLPYAVSGLFYWLSGSLHFALIALWIIPSLFGGWGMNKLLRNWWGSWSAVVGTLSLTLAPYRAVDLYVRGAVSEVWGIMWFPWILYWLWQTIRKGDTRSLILLSLSISGLALSHNLMTMIFLPVVVLAASGWIYAQKHWQTATYRAGLGIFLGICLSSFYLVPALVEKGYTQIEQRILSGYFHYSQHFLYIRQFFQENWGYGGSNWGPVDDLSFFLGFGQIVLLILLMIIISYQLYSWWTTHKSKKLGLIRKYWTSQNVLVFTGFFMAGSGLYMSLLKSSWLWAAIPILATIQFPWRFLSLAIMGIAILNGYLIQRISITSLKIGTIAVGAVLMLGFAPKYFRPEFYLDNISALYYADPERIQTEMSGIWPDFIPLQVSAEISPRESWVIGQVDHEVILERAHQLVIKVNSRAEETIVLAIADFPGWQVYADGKPINHQTSEQGLIEITLPAGGQVVSVNFERTPVRLWSEVVSLISGIILLSMLYVSAKPSHV